MLLSRRRSGSRSTCKAAASASPNSGALVDFIFERHDHFDADELIEALSQRDEGEPRQPADRLPHAERTGRGGLLRRMTLGGRAVYEHDYGYPSTTTCTARSATG